MIAQDSRSPHPSNTGADNSKNSDSDQSGHIGSIDYLRLTGPKESAIKAMRTAAVRVGGFEDTGRATKHYRRLWLSPDGETQFLVDNYNGGNWQLEMKGQVCQQLGREAILALYRELESGVCKPKCTRIDLAVDLIGDCHEMLTDLRTSHKSKQVKPPVSIDSRCPEYSDGSLIGDSIYFGSVSSRWFVRIYDKGLQTKTRAQGEWIRWELECQKDAAPGALLEVLKGDCDKSIAPIVKGFFQSIEGPGKKHWERLGEDWLRIQAPKKARSGQGFIDFQCQKNTAPTLNLAAQELGMDVYEFAAEMGVFDLQGPPKRSYERERVVRDLVMMYNEIQDGREAQETQRQED